MSLKQVHKLEAAADALREEAREAGRVVPAAQMWLISTGGFISEAHDDVQDREGIYLFRPRRHQQHFHGLRRQLPHPGVSGISMTPSRCATRLLHEQIYNDKLNRPVGQL